MKKAMLLFFLFTGNVACSNDEVKLDTFFLETAVVTESKPGNGFLNSSIIRSNQGRNASGLLQELSSVYVKNYGNGQLSSLSVRGTGAQQSVISWNGVNLNSVFLGQSDLSLFPVGLHQACNLELSPNQGIIGGRLNFISQPDFRKKTDFTYTGRFGSFHSFQNQLGFVISNSKFYSSTFFNQNQSKNNFLYTDLTSENKEKRELQNASWNQISAIQTLAFSVHPSLQLVASVWFHQSNRRIPSIFKTNNRERQDDRNIRSQFQMNSAFGKHQFNASFTHLNDLLIYQNPSISLEANSQSNAFRTRLFYQYFLKNFLIIKVEGGGDYESAKTNNYTSDAQRALFFGELQAEYQVHKVKGLQLYFAYRHEWFGRNSSPALPSFKIKYQRQLKEHIIETEAKVARNFRAPTLNDWYWNGAGNPELSAEKSTNAEWSLGWNFNSYAKVRITNFYSLINDYIQWSPQSNGIWRPTNLKSVFNRGVEIQLSGQSLFLNKKIRLSYFSSYSYCRSTNYKSTDDSKQLIYVPAHKLNAFLDFNVFGHFIKPSVNFTGIRYTTSTNERSLALAPYVLFNLEAGKTFYVNNHSFTASFNVQNLLNKEYTEIAGRPLRGRYYEFTLQINIHE